MDRTDGRNQWALIAFLRPAGDHGPESMHPLPGPASDLRVGLQVQFAVEASVLLELGDDLGGVAHPSGIPSGHVTGRADRHTKRANPELPANPRSIAKPHRTLFRDDGS